MSRRSNPLPMYWVYSKLHHPQDYTFSPRKRFLYFFHWRNGGLSPTLFFKGGLGR